MNINLLINYTVLNFRTNREISTAKLSAIDVGIFVFDDFTVCKWTYFFI